MRFHLAEGQSATVRMPSAHLRDRDCCPPRKVSQPGSRHRRTTGGKLFCPFLADLVELAARTEMLVNHRRTRGRRPSRGRTRLACRGGDASFRGGRASMYPPNCLLLTRLSRWAARADRSPSDVLRAVVFVVLSRSMLANRIVEIRQGISTPADRRGEGAYPRLQVGDLALQITRRYSGTCGRLLLSRTRCCPATGSPIR